MIYKVEKSTQAMRDIEEAFVYIANDNLDIAVHFLTATEESTEALARRPFIGSPRAFNDTKLKNLRLWRVKGFERYLIIYTVLEDTVKVLRVINAKRDFNLLLFS
jgi:addiction module RelE/StbE family toxin